MSYVATFGLEFGINAAVLIATTLPAGSNSKVQIGCGGKARDDPRGALTGGGRPDIVLYDTHGQEIRRSVGGEPFDPGSNPIIEMGDLIRNIVDPAKGTITPEYAKLIARGDDAVCVSYVSTTSVGNDKRTWHAGYAKECAQHLDIPFWYPSPEIIPGTDFRPGCVWMSSDSREGMPMAVSFKLTDFAFPTSEEAEKAKKQYEKTPNTLCQAPGRMAFWDTTYPNDCIPFYDFTVERNETTGFDMDNQKIVDGHTIPCTIKGLLMKQTLEPGQGPRTPKTLTEEEEEEANEDGTNPNGAPSCAGSFGGECGQSSQEEADRLQREQDQRLSEEGQNPNGQAPGAGSFGGICGVIPADSNVAPGEPVIQVHPCSTTNPAATPTSPTANPAPTVAAPDISRRTRNRKRRTLRRNDMCNDRLVISHHQEHSAREVCGMERSWGPDFVSKREMMHCDMCTRVLTPLCENGKDTGEGICFDLEKRIMRRSISRVLKARREQKRVERATKKYFKVEEWEE
ncbi:hypothetical protein BDW02DRAFT_594544 [Decorospora gaudefroyi]|uniref:Uncharacterized protein n=1 Tax=Decorospora gaudefroyi TaxID=184978 RepID=A0A6A5KMY3_9PLEO|nr:hypothetical protein BDW02DRAFT_594544 [Decorospora gaudefroyi]